MAAGTVVAQALLIINFAFGVGLYQGFGDVLGIGGHKDGVVPNVGVIFAVVVVVSFVVVVVMVSAFFFGFEGLDAFGRFGIGYFALFDGTLHIGSFKSQAVNQDEFCTADFFDVAAGEVVGVGILVGSDQTLYGYALSADLFGNVA